MNDEKIIKNIKERMALYNLEKEYNMRKKSGKKLLISLVLFFVLAGSLATVNAATDGSITKAIKDVIPGWTRTERQTEKGTIVKYTAKTKDGKTVYVEYYDNEEGKLKKLNIDKATFDKKIQDKLKAIDNIK